MANLSSTIFSLKAIFTTCVISASTFVFAQSAYYSEANKSIARVGAQQTAQGLIYYVYFVEPLGQNCQFATVYVTSDRKGLYTQLLAAKLSNRRISRVDYSQPGGAGTQCNAELVELAD